MNNRRDGDPGRGGPGQGAGDRGGRGHGRGGNGRGRGRGRPPGSPVSDSERKRKANERQRQVRQRRKQKLDAIKGFKPTGDFQKDVCVVAGRNVEACMDYIHPLIKASWNLTDAIVVAHNVENPKNGFLVKRREGGERIAIGIHPQAKATNPLFEVETKNLTITIKVKDKGVFKDWLEIKESKIPGAGLGVFALREFKKGEVIGMYSGSRVHTRESNNVALQNHSNQRFIPDSNQIYMGMHFINSSWKSKTLKENVQVNDDFLCEALKKIKVGDELLWDYEYGPEDEQEG